MKDALYKIRKSTLDAIGNAIRSKANKTDKINPLNMPEEILSLQLGDINFAQQTTTEEQVEEGYTFFNKYGLLSTGTAKATIGSTVEPVDDVSIWQKCAGLSATYTTVEQILEDTAALTTLLQNANAIEYLIRSTTILNSILANSNAISILDNSMPYINPDMSSNTVPYGEVTHNIGNSYQYYGIFNTGGTDTSSSYYISNGKGCYVEWKTTATKGVVPYKVTAQDVYGNNSVIKFIGIDENGNTFDLTDNITLPKDTVVTATPKIFKRCVGIRVYIVEASKSANNWVRYQNCKIYAI